MIGFILGLGRFIPAWMRRAALAFSVAAAGLLAAFLAGRRDGKKDAAVKDAKEYAKTRKRVDNAKGSSGDTDSDINWLHDYGDK